MNSLQGHPKLASRARGFQHLLVDPPWWTVLMLVVADLIDRPIVTRAIWAAIVLAVLMHGPHGSGREEERRDDVRQEGS